MTNGTPFLLILQVDDFNSTYEYIKTRIVTLFIVADRIENWLPLFR